MKLVLRKLDLVNGEYNIHVKTVWPKVFHQSCAVVRKKTKNRLLRWNKYNESDINTCENVVSDFE